MIVPLSLRSFINHKRLFGIDSGVGMKGRGRYLPRELAERSFGGRGTFGAPFRRWDSLFYLFLFQ